MNLSFEYNYGQIIFRAVHSAYSTNNSQPIARTFVKLSSFAICLTSERLFMDLFLVNCNQINLR